MLRQKLSRGQTGHAIIPDSLNHIQTPETDQSTPPFLQYQDISLVSHIHANIAPVPPALTPSTLLSQHTKLSHPILASSTSLHSNSSLTTSTTLKQPQRVKKQNNNNNIIETEIAPATDEVNVDFTWTVLSHAQNELTAPSLLSAQTVKSINPYHELKHLFGSSSVLLPPPQQHQKRIIQQINNSPHIPQEERRRLLNLYQRQGRESLLTPGVSVQRHSSLFYAHYCEQTTLIANGLSSASQITPNTVLYYCWLTPSMRLYDDLQTFSNLQNSYDHQSIIEFSHSNVHLPQALFHLSYIFEYHNKVDNAFDWIRMAVASFENGFGKDLLPLIFAGKVRFIHSILPNERDTIIRAHQNNSIFANDFQKVQGYCNQELFHIMNKVIARYCHFLCKKASSGSAYGLSALALRLSSHYMILSSQTIGPASFFNLKVAASQSQTPLSDNNLFETTLESLNQHLSIPNSEISTNVAAQYDSSSLSYFYDYYGLKGSRYYDVILAGLFNLPNIFGTPSNDIIQTIHASTNNNIELESQSPLQLQNTTSLSELFYAYSAAILYPLIQAKNAKKPTSISISPHTSRSIFPIYTPIARWSLNWSYSIAYAMFMLNHQHSHAASSFTHTTPTLDSQLDFSTEIDAFTDQFDLISLLSFDQIGLYQDKIFNTLPYLGLPASQHYYRQLIAQQQQQQQQFTQQLAQTSHSQLQLPSNSFLTIDQLLTSPHVVDNSLLFTLLTSQQNVNTMPTRGRGINPLTGINVQQRTMLKNLFPKKFTSLAYLARAIVLFPEALKALLPDFTSDEYTDLMALYSTDEGQNGFHDKVQSVFAKRCSALWGQTRVQAWIKAGVVCAHKILRAFTKQLNFPNSAASSAQFHPVLSSALLEIRRTLYNPSYYSSHDYQLKHLEQADYCDDVVRFDPNDVFAPSGGRQSDRSQAQDRRGALQATLAAALESLSGVARAGVNAAANAIDPSILEEFLPLIFDQEDDDDGEYEHDPFDEEFID